MLGDGQRIECGLEDVAHLGPELVQDALFDLHERWGGAGQRRPRGWRGGPRTRGRRRGRVGRDADLGDQRVQRGEAPHRRRPGRRAVVGDAGRGFARVGVGSAGHCRRCSKWRLMAEIASIACQYR